MTTDTPTPRTSKFTGLLASHSWMATMFDEMLLLELELSTCTATTEAQTLTILRLEKELEKLRSEAKHGN